MAKLTTDEILAYLEEATILELNELVKAIEEKFDVTAAAPVAVAARPFVVAAEGAGPPDRAAPLRPRPAQRSTDTANTGFAPG